jgi:hypothetical protein
MSWSVVDWWFPGESDRAAELDERNRQLNRRREAMGQQSPEQSFAQEQRFEATSDYNAWDAQVWDGFKSGAAEGANKAADVVRGAIAAPIQWTLRAIPWQLWAVAIVWGLWYVGASGWARNRLAK